MLVHLRHAVLLLLLHAGDEALLLNPHLLDVLPQPGHLVLLLLIELCLSCSGASSLTLLELGMIRSSYDDDDVT